MDTTQRYEDFLAFAHHNQRRVFLMGAVEHTSCARLIEQMWALEYENNQKPILFVINSPGGSVTDGMALWDQIKLLKSPVYTLVSGMAASMGSVLSLVAPQPHRYCTPNARIMIHQPHIPGVIQGQASDLAIQSEQILRSRDAIAHLYMEATGKSYEEILKSLDRDTWMDAKEAHAFGLIDTIITSIDTIPLNNG